MKSGADYVTLVAGMTHYLSNGKFKDAVIQQLAAYDDV
jgi:hypothetical protein